MEVLESSQFSFHNLSFRWHQIAQMVMRKHYLLSVCNLLSWMVNIRLVNSIMKSMRVVIFCIKPLCIQHKRAYLHPKKYGLITFHSLISADTVGYIISVGRQCFITLHVNSFTLLGHSHLYIFVMVVAI